MDSVYDEHEPVTETWAANVHWNFSLKTNVNQTLDKYQYSKCRYKYLIFKCCILYFYTKCIYLSPDVLGTCTRGARQLCVRQLCVRQLCV